MMEPKPTQTRVQPRNLLGVLAFLRAYPAPVVLSVSLLLVNITARPAGPYESASDSNVSVSSPAHVSILRV